MNNVSLEEDSEEEDEENGEEETTNGYSSITAQSETSLPPSGKP